MCSYCRSIKLVYGILFVLVASCNDNSFADEPYFPGQKFLIDYTAEDMAVGDLNGDTITDLVFANGTAESISILFRNGHGAIENQLKIPLFDASRPKSITISDLNLDGVNDLAIANTPSAGNVEETRDVAIILGLGSGTFSDPQYYETGYGPTAIIDDDFNGDGIVDLAVANREIQSMQGADGEYSILLGNGDGSFVNFVEYPAPDSPVSLQTGDFDGDGNIDLVATNLDTNEVSVLIGNGDGTFLEAQNYAVGDFPIDVLVVDMDNDSNDDLVVLNNNSENVSLLTGNGDGSFNEHQLLPAGLGPTSIDYGDVNDDGWMDIVTTDRDFAGTIFLNQGDGTFVTENFALTLNSPRAISISDLNNDSFLDFTVVNGGFNQSVSIYLGIGKGELLERKDLFVGNTPETVESGDFNNDGWPDLAVATSDSNECAILLGDGDGCFEIAQTLPVGDAPMEVLAQDLNGDGIIDLAIANRSNNFDIDTVTVAEGIGNGLFGNLQNYTVGFLPIDIAAGDFNMDGNTDLVVACLGLEPFELPSAIYILFGQGNGQFQDGQPILSTDAARSVEVADFNSDFIDDIAFAAEDENGADQLMIMYGIGNGTFSDVVIQDGLVGPDSLALADLNNDGIVDILLEDLNTVVVLLGLGDGSFESPQAWPVGRIVVAVSTADVNQDGYIDILAANNDSRDVSVLFGLGDGTFEETLYFAVDGGPKDVGAGDFNGDGLVDLCSANSFGTISILLNQMDSSVLIGDVNGDGEVDLLDVQPFVQVITDNDFQAEADINKDGVVDLLDVAPFVDLLIN